jgi:dTDP-4-amino-4,6-dideoxygalactose transaminase
MEVPFVDLKKQISLIRNELDIVISSVIDSSYFVKGEEVANFENRFSRMIGLSNAIGVGNGTDALLIALKSIGIQRGDEVIVPANTFIATAEAVTAVGAKVVFVDCCPDTYNIDCSLIKQKITTHTKAIIPVHLYGQIANMDEIIRIADKYRLYVIEDAAQSHFASYCTCKGDWKNAGALSHIAAFSFFPGKNLGAFGDAGAVVTNDSILAKKVRMYANHGRVSKYDHKFEGYNSRMDTIQAAILNVKLKYIDDWTARRREVAATYLDLLRDVSEIDLPVFENNQNPSWHLFVVRAKNRTKLVDYLKDNGISTGIHYPKALPFLKAYAYLNSKDKDYPIAYSYQNLLLSLPIFPEITAGQIKYVCKKIEDFYSN